MIETYIKLGPTTPKGPWSIAKRANLRGGSYNIICTCRWESNADAILQALRSDEFSGKIIEASKHAKK